MFGQQPVYVIGIPGTPGEQGPPGPAGAAGPATGKRTLTIGAPGDPGSDVQLSAAAHSQTVNIGAVLPANALPLLWELQVVTTFGDGGVATMNLSLGGTVATSLVSAQSIDSTAVGIQFVTGAGVRSVAAQSYGLNHGGQQLVATFNGSVNMSTYTNGRVKVTVYYVIGS